jgi:ABC-2 type transport system permease protein
MRAFAEEKKEGTMEFLLTKPITDLQIIFAKYLGCLVLVLLSLVPCLIYYWSVSVLGNPPGNLDTGATWGAFLGLFFLAAIYVAIGVFISSLTNNQIVAFIVAVTLSFILYAGFDYFASLLFLQSLSAFILNIGIDEHYKSISRGVIDSRDVIYYFGVIAFFILLTKIRLQSRNW